MNNAHIPNINTFDAKLAVRRAKELIFQQFDDEWLAVDDQASVCFSFNESAGRIWHLHENPMLLDAIWTQLCVEYEVDYTTYLPEVNSLVQSLEQAGLVKLGD